MVQTKKKNSEAFGDILAALDTAAPDRSTPPASNADVSWTDSLRSAASRRKAWDESALVPEKVSDPATQLRRSLGSWGWRSGVAHASSESAYAQEAASLSSAAEVGQSAGTTPTDQQDDMLELLEPAPGAQPIAGWRRLLSRISWRWRNVEERLPSPDEPPGEAAPSLAIPVELAAPTPASKTEEEAISNELGLSADFAVVDLKRIRREFAKKNHPDRCHPGQRVEAARRMTIANMLIDERLKGKSLAK
jgi:hypothetical protein